MNLVPERRWTLCAIALGLILLTLAGLTRLQTEANYRVYFEADDPLLALEQQIAERFGLADSAVLVVDAGVTDLIAPARLRAYQRFEEALLALPAVEGVSGFYQWVESVDTDDPFASGDLDAWQQLLSHPRGQDLVSADRGLGLIEVRIARLQGDSASYVVATMAQLESLVNRYLLGEAGVDEVVITGIMALNHAYITVVRHDLLRFVPALLLVIAAILFLFLRNVWLVMLPLGTGLLVAMMAMGVGGWAGWTLAAINAFAPIIIVSLHLAAIMHLVVAYLRYRAEDLDGEQAAARSLAFNLTAMSLSALTTAGGFLLLALSPSPPIRLVGYSVAVGVLFSYLFNLLLVPRLLVRIPLRPERLELALGAISRFGRPPGLRLGRRSVILIALVLAGLALLPLSRYQIDDSVYDYFPADHDFSRGIALLDQSFNGCVRLSFVIQGEPSGAALTASYQEAQSALVSWLGARPEVSAVGDIYTLMERRGIDLAAGRQLLLERSVSELGIDHDIVPELSSTRVVAHLRALSSAQLIDFSTDAREWLSEALPALEVAGGSSPDLIFAHLGQRNAYSMFTSLGIALLVVALLLGLMFQDVLLAMAGLMCNLLPLMLVYALWFAAGGYVSLGAAVVLGMIMGVIIDDTLHLLCKYRRITRLGGADPVRRLRETAMPAVVITSVTLVAGLSVGLLSDFRPLRELSLLSSAVILAALIVDAVLLPAVLSIHTEHTRHER